MARLMDIYQLYLRTIATVNTQQGGCLKPTTFVEWCNQISTELFNEKFCNAETSQKNDDELNNTYLRSLNVVVTPNPGRNFDTITLPADYGYFSSLRIFLAQDADCGCLNKEHNIQVGDQCGAYEDPAMKEIRERYKAEYANEVTARKIDNARFGSAAKSIIMPVTIQNPIVTQVNGGLKIVPRDVGIVVLDYFKLPVKAVMSFTTVPGTDVINYNLGASTQLDWPDLVENEFIARLKKRYASFTRNQAQYAEGELERKQTK